LVPREINMAVDSSTFAVASVLCTMDLRRLRHLLQAFDMGDVAQEVMGIDKGALIARLVTHGLDKDEAGYSPAEFTVIGFACVTGMREQGVSVGELRAMLQLLRGEAMASEILRRMRQGAKT
jgi:hypothetical protein